MLLIALALIAMPCSAADGAASSDDAAVTNQTPSPTPVATTDVTTSPPATTEATTVTTTTITTTGTTEVTPTNQPTTAVTTSPTTAAPVNATVALAEAPGSGSAENLGASPQAQPEITVTIGPIPLLASFNSTATSGTAPLYVTFTDRSGGSGRAWYFGDEPYTTPWTWQASNPWGDEGNKAAVVSLQNGYIVAMAENGDVKNKVWMSENMGKNWTVQTDNAGWSSQADQPAVALSDGSIILMTGTQYPKYFSNSVQRSTDQGKTWIRQTGYPDWHQRAGFSAVALSDDSIVLMAGYNPDSGTWVKDVWRSTDKGATWKQQTSDSGFPTRNDAPAVALSDGSIVVMGGVGNTGSMPSKNDVWRSTDKGVTWTQQTASAEWSPRHGGSAVALPDDSILLIGAENETASFKEVWRSADKGKTWVQVSASTEWGQGSPRDSAIVMPDGSVVLINRPGVGFTYGVWRLETAGSTAQNPTHLYLNEGTYSVALRAYNAVGYSTVLKTGYITVTNAPKSVVLFGDLNQVTNLPTYTDYSSLGGDAAIRRNGMLEHFIGPLGTLNSEFKKYTWAQATNGAGITTSGDLGTWDPRGSPSKTGKILDMQNASPDKKYLMVSQYFDGSLPNKDWRLVLYADRSGATHLEAQGDATDNPDVFNNVPNDTGWIRVAAGKDHALALRSNGSVVAWGKNYAGQLDLPTNAVYSDIAAGAAFSLGLTAEGNESAGGYIRAAGGNKYGEVSGVPANQSTYITIDAGPYTGAALTHDGHILVWGKNMTGVQTPTDGNYTDISLGPDYGIAIHEPVAEIHVTGPISPGKPIPNSDGLNLDLPRGATIECTANDVTRIFDQNGIQIAWANDEDATTIQTPNGNTLPTTVIHYLPSGSLVDSTTPRKVTVSDPKTNEILLKINENVGDESYSLSANSYPLHLPTIPQGVCYANTGCSAANTAKHHLFLSQPFNTAIDYSPIYSVEYLGDNGWSGTLCKRGSDDQCSGDISSLIIKNNAIDPNVSHSVSLVTITDLNNAGPSSIQSIDLDISSSVRSYTYTATAKTENENFDKITVTANLKHSDTVIDTTTKSTQTDPSVVAQGTKDITDNGKYKTSGEADFTHNGRSPLIRSGDSGISEIYYIDGIPQAQQICNQFCVVAVAQMATKYYGLDNADSRSQCDIAKTMGVDTSQVDCDKVDPTLTCPAATASGEIGYYTKAVNDGGLGKSGSLSVTPTFDTINTEIKAKRPVKAGKDGHARLIVGTKQENLKNKIIWRDPVCPEGKTGTDCYSSAPSTVKWIEELEYPTLTGIIVIKD
ncbi:hypothetical protein [Methanoregula sp. UBA64]|uniref:hypothetical protein n=1 Tax=Methanoregula sp. UBA64 TaxID=1915554 RepID=UPI0025EBEF55|nr:hypothetical protein [Methanoregula sp. UBA64]